MRLFLAIELPDAARRHLAEIGARGNFVEEVVSRRLGVDAAASVTRPENLHVTLKFLGEVEAPAVGRLCEALGRVEVGAPVVLHAAGAELLPPRGPVRVIAAGLEGDVGRVGQWHRAVEEACAGLGFASERRPYLPHVTLARARRPLPPAARGVLKEELERRLPGPGFEADGFALFESRLGKGPPAYVRVARFGGAGAGGGARA